MTHLVPARLAREATIKIKIPVEPRPFALVYNARNAVSKPTLKVGCGFLVVLRISSNYRSNHIDPTRGIDGFLSQQRLRQHQKHVHGKVAILFCTQNLEFFGNRHIMRDMRGFPLSSMRSASTLL